jgi:hypothetical protein
MDEETQRILTKMQLPHVQLIQLSDFEKNDQLLINAKQNRSVIEYYFTCTPSLPLYVLAHSSDVDIITYLDADLYFFSSLEPAYQELGNGSILIIGHRFPPDLKDREIYGIYNVGMLSFRNDDNGHACLHWWRNRCLEWCYKRIENGRFADQKYLDDWPNRFTGVIVLQHKGVGLAPWNIANYSYSWKKNKLFVDGQVIVMYHFHGLKQINRWMYDSNVVENKTRLLKILKQGVYVPYLKELYQIKQNLNKFGLENSGKNLSIPKSIETPISFKMKIHEMLKIEYIQKFVNNDLIIDKH